MTDENTAFKEDFIDWAKRHQLPLSDDELSAVHLFEEQAHIIEECLFDIFVDKGSMSYAETGCSPAEHLPAAIYQYLELLNTEHPWQVDNIRSDDGWQTARISLSNTEQQYTAVLEHVDNSDWLSPDVALRMKELSAQYGDQTLVTFFGDDPYVIVAMAHEAAVELDALVEKYVEPY